MFEAPRVDTKQDHTTSQGAVRRKSGRLVHKREHPSAQFSVLSRQGDVNCRQLRAKVAHVVTRAAISTTQGAKFDPLANLIRNPSTLIYSYVENELLAIFAQLVSQCTRCNSSNDVKPFFLPQYRQLFLLLSTTDNCFHAQEFLISQSWTQIPGDRILVSL